MVDISFVVVLSGSLPLFGTGNNSNWRER